MSNDFPESYPHRLRPISWGFGEIAGVRHYYTRNMPFELKSSPWFVHNVLRDVIMLQGVESISNELDEVLQIWMRVFNVIFTDEEECFRLSVRKDKKTGKRVKFPEAEWFAACAACGLSKRQGTDLLKFLNGEVVKRYNLLMQKQPK